MHYVNLLSCDIILLPCCLDLCTEFAEYCICLNRLWVQTQLSEYSLANDEFNELKQHNGRRRKGRVNYSTEGY